VSLFVDGNYRKVMLNRSLMCGECWKNFWNLLFFIAKALFLGVWFYKKI